MTPVLVTPRAVPAPVVRPLSVVREPDPVVVHLDPDLVPQPHVVPLQPDDRLSRSA